jgi:threonine aldolase
MRNIKIDFFSDTNVEPSKAMREVMCSAKVGNEVAGEDPTVNQLIQTVCELLGKEAGIFMPSGTMCNGVAYRVWCQRAGDRILFDQYAHAAIMAAGLPGGLVQATPISIQTERGIFNASQLKSAIGEKKGYNIPPARIISIEQTTNYGGGAIWPISILKEIYELAKENNIVVHMDGARLFNAVVATNISAKEYCRYADSVWIDFAKGLGAPMGAVLCGSKNFIDDAWYYKFQQGGGMHQVGILAAGCMYALENNIKRLSQDHQNAKFLATELAKQACINIAPNQIETNIVIFRLKDTDLSAYAVAHILVDKYNIRLLAIDKITLRAIVHMDIKEQDILVFSRALQHILLA